jgi:peptide-methionine (S)-S-oxide reductase
MMVNEAEALPGRSVAMIVPARHHVLGSAMKPPFAVGLKTVIFAMGCFWGAERIFWEADGVHTTAVGYVAGFTPNPTYEEVCSGQTGHTEAVLVAYDHAKVSLPALFSNFWEGHDPTQEMRQGNDVGSQYRSGIYLEDGEDIRQAQASRESYQALLSKAGHGAIVTEIRPGGPFYYAEEYHQQYLAKNPGGYCGLGGTGVSCPVGLGAGD